MGLNRSPDCRRKAALPSFALIGAVIVGLIIPATGIARQSPGLADLAEQVKHCVVNLSTTQVVQAQPGHPGLDQDSPLRDFFGEEFFERFFGGLPQRERRANALGSGFIISSDGLILTNHHVVAKATEIKVRLENGKEYDAELVGSDPKTDLALIRVEPEEGFPEPARLGNSDDIRVGAGVMAVGNPFGLGHTVTAGIVSAKGRIIGAGPYDDFLQTDAAINPGNSGGPLFNMDGEVVGIATAIVAQAQGIGFAIPINLAVELLPQLKKGKVVRGWLGVMIQDLTPELADSLGLESAQGVLISDVVADSPAAEAGLQRGDVIVAVDDQPVSEAPELSRRIAGTNPGTRVDITVIRNGDEQNIPVTLGTLPDENAAETQPQESEQPEETWGFTVQTLTPELARRLGLETDQKGVVIVNTVPGSPAAESGLQEGDLITEVNRTPVDNLSDFNKVLRGTDKDRLLLLVKRGQGSLYIVLKR